MVKGIEDDDEDWAGPWGVEQQTTVATAWGIEDLQLEPDALKRELEFRRKQKKNPIGFN